ncbi:16S rRNA (guanine(527)-N(7))-methyltransferase RsmG [uncultured Tyzzerella sp.]|uniref:16S rRNA (guanine(527)-N(7))-methyltransferase RsmG n=1 Tax=uncultured Tyzzerella sp. TaxID=2321398 RepID=UPI002942D920|nr:16S rRNA (guanine(527)-N(7))-methyltransferase RsmG [uncultured Tyzzerella sp.]
MKNLLKNACKELNLILDDSQIDDFLKYKELLLEWNEKINLTAITNDREIILKHFVDCLTVCKFVDFNNKSFIDVGTGAGFPAIPIKIFCKGSSPTLLDSLNKRINFLKTVGKELNLQNITYVHSRAEDGGQDVNFREKYDFCVSRAVANLSVLAEFDLPFVKVGGYFIALKGPLLDSEIIDAKKAISTLGGEIEKIETIKIPFTDIEHKLVFIKKLRQTPKQYPRKAGKIPKSPIK